MTAHALNNGGRKQRDRLLPIALLSVALAACFVYVPWERVAGGGFPDRDNYLAAIDVLISSGATPFDFNNANLLALLMNEYLWREVLVLIGGYFEKTADGLLLVSFLGAALATFHIVRRAGVAYALVFLFSPLTIDLFISQTRSALALGVFLSALATRRPFLKYALFAAAFFIHSFAAILFIAYQFNSVLLRISEIGTRNKFAAVLLFALAGSAIWAFLAVDILAAIGDRRASQEAILPTSLPFALWWMLLTSMLVAFARIGTWEGNSHYVMLAIFLQGMFVFSTIFGAGGLRFLSLSLPFVFIAMRSIRVPVVRIGALVGTFGFSLVLFLYWIS